MSISITGSNGFVGMWLCRALSINNYNRFDVLEGNDITRQSIQKKVVSGHSTVIHLASISGLKACQDDPKKARLINTVATMNLAKLAKRHNVKRFIFASTSAVYGESNSYLMNEQHDLNPRSVYGKTKLAAEKILDLSNNNFTVIILRKSNIFGWGYMWKGITVIDKFIEKYFNKEPFEIRGDGSQKRDFVNLQDIIWLYKEIATAKSVKSGIYNIGGNECISIIALAEMVNSIGEYMFGYRVPIKHHNGDLGMTSHDFKYSSDKARCEFKFVPQFDIKSYLIERFKHEMRR